MAEMYHDFGLHGDTVRCLRWAAFLELVTQTIDLLITQTKNAQGLHGANTSIFRSFLGADNVGRSWALAALRLVIYEDWVPSICTGALTLIAGRVAPVSDVRVVRAMPVLGISNDARNATSDFRTISGAVVTHDHQNIRVIAQDLFLVKDEDATSYEGNRLRRQPFIRFDGEAVTRLDEAFLGGYLRNYFHWLVEVVPILKLYLDNAMNLPILTLGPEPTSFKAEFFVSFGLADRVRPLLNRPCQVDVGSLAVSGYLFGASQAQASAVTCLREELMGRLVINRKSAGPERIYATRTDARLGRILGESEIIEYLVGRGFTVVTPGKHGLLEQARLFSNARVIVGVHGAGLANITFGPPPPGLSSSTTLETIQATRCIKYYLGWWPFS